MVTILKKHDVKVTRSGPCNNRMMADKFSLDEVLEAVLHDDFGMSKGDSGRRRVNLTMESQNDRKLEL